MKKQFQALTVGIVIINVAMVWENNPLQANEVEDAAPAREAPWQEWDGISGDWWGLRTELEDRELEIFGGYTAEVWGNTSGGLKRGTVYTGLLDFGANLDLDKLVGWEGASVSTTWLWLSGRDASEDLTGNFLTISNIAGFNTLRLFELWFQQNLFDDVISLRFGQLAADSEFIISDYGAAFINGTFGWPAFMYTNLPEGGPGYPMGTLGIRLAISPVDWFTFLSGIFQGNVYAQDVNRHGFRWRLDSENGLLFLNEAQLRWNHREEEMGLPGQFKTGFWAQTGHLADALSDYTNSGNYGFYFIIDQMLYREPTIGSSLASFSKVKDPGDKNSKHVVSSEKSDQGLGWFGRIAFEKDDRNFVGFYFDTGLTYKGLIPTRDDDTLGIAFAYAQLTNDARSGLSMEGLSPIGAEMVIEFTYQAQVTKWLAIQPDLQFIINPGSTTDLGNAFVIGGRASITF